MCVGSLPYHGRRELLLLLLLLFSLLLLLLATVLWFIVGADFVVGWVCKSLCRVNYSGSPKLKFLD